MSKSADSNQRRDEFGVIATLTDGYVLHASGLRIDALRRVAAVCDDRGVQVASLSTPETIATDLQGARISYRSGHAVTEFPEAYLLSRIGRRDLWARGYTEPPKGGRAYGP